MNTVFYAVVLSWHVASPDGYLNAVGPFTDLGTCRVAEAAIYKTREPPPGYTRQISCQDQNTINVNLQVLHCQEVDENPLPGRTDVSNWVYACYTIG
jgi:hypothetical protein